MSEGEKDFLDELYKSMLVEWAAQTSASGGITDPSAGASTPGAKALSDQGIAYAQVKGWVSKTAPLRVLSGGYKVAAAYLRR